MFNGVYKLEAKRIYRIGISFVVFFVGLNVLVETGLSSYDDTLRASEILLDDNVCNFAEEDFSDIEGEISSDPNPKIFLMGDSVSYGIGVEEESESVSGYLRELYPEYSVYNLSSCGSKPLDYYLWSRYLAEVDPNPDNICLIQYNYKWFNADNGELEDRVSQKRMLFNFKEYVDGEMHPSDFESLKAMIAGAVPVYANKTKLFATIFNEKSKEDFIEHTFFGKPPQKTFAHKSQNWREKDEMKNFNCKIAYSGSEWDPEENFNFSVYLKTLDFLKEQSVKALVFLPAYNYELTKKCQNTGFEENVDLFASEALARNITTASFNPAIDESYFLDDMHLSESGNKLFAEEIADYIDNLNNES